MILRMHDQNTNQEWGFEVSGPGDERLSDIPEEIWGMGGDGLLEDFVSELESEYGVFDFSGYMLAGDCVLDILVALQSWVFRLF